MADCAMGAGLRYLGDHHSIAIELDKPGILNAEEPERPAGEEDPELEGDAGTVRNGP